MKANDKECAENGLDLLMSRFGFTKTVQKKDITHKRYVVDQQASIAGKQLIVFVEDNEVAKNLVQEFFSNEIVIIPHPKRTNPGVLEVAPKQLILFYKNNQQNSPSDSKSEKLVLVLKTAEIPFDSMETSIGGNEILFLFKEEKDRVAAEEIFRQNSFDCDGTDDFLYVSTACSTEKVQDFDTDKKSLYVKTQLDRLSFFLRRHLSLRVEHPIKSRLVTSKTFVFLSPDSEEHCRIDCFSPAERVLLDKQITKAGFTCAMINGQQNSLMVNLIASSAPVIIEPTTSKVVEATPAPIVIDKQSMKAVYQNTFSTRDINEIVRSINIKANNANWRTVSNDSFAKKEGQDFFVLSFKTAEDAVKAFTAINAKIPSSLLRKEKFLWVPGNVVQTSNTVIKTVLPAAKAITNIENAILEDSVLSKETLILLKPFINKVHADLSRNYEQKMKALKAENEELAIKNQAIEQKISESILISRSGDGYLVFPANLIGAGLPIRFEGAELHVDKDVINKYKK